MNKYSASIHITGIHMRPSMNPKIRSIISVTKIKRIIDCWWNLSLIPSHRFRGHWWMAIYPTCLPSWGQVTFKTLVGWCEVQSSSWHKMSNLHRFQQNASCWITYITLWKEWQHCWAKLLQYCWKKPTYLNNTGCVEADPDPPPPCLNICVFHIGFFSCNKASLWADFKNTGDRGVLDFVFCLQFEGEIVLKMPQGYLNIPRQAFLFSVYFLLCQIVIKHSCIDSPLLWGFHLLLSF